jgi:hypothetical protein
MKELHEVPRDSYVMISSEQEDDIKVPVGSTQIEKGDILYFSHIDGMYSLCYIVDKDTLEIGESCHIAAWTKVEVITLEELMPFEKIRKVIGRSGYGKDGKGAYREAVLADMSDEWVKASIEYVSEDHKHHKLYIRELHYRRTNGITIKDKQA